MDIKNLNIIREHIEEGTGGKVDKIVDICECFVDVKLSKHDTIVITEVVIYV